MKFFLFSFCAFLALAVVSIQCQTMPEISDTYTLEFEDNWGNSGTLYKVGSSQFRADVLVKDTYQVSILVLQDASANVTTVYTQVKLNVAVKYCITATTNHVKYNKAPCTKNPTFYIGQKTWEDDEVLTEGWARNCTTPKGRLYRTYKYWFEESVPYAWKTNTEIPDDIEGYTMTINSFSTSTPSSNLFTPFSNCNTLKSSVTKLQGKIQAKISQLKTLWKPSA